MSKNQKNSKHLFLIDFFPTFFSSNFYFSTFFFHPIIFNEHLSPKYKTIKEQILTVHDSQMYSGLIYSTRRQLKYLVNKQGYLINRDDCSDMQIQNALLFVIIFGTKINKCEHYLTVKVLIFRFYDMGKKNFPTI
jgi:hypothetical protein